MFIHIEDENMVTNIKIVCDVWAIAIHRLICKVFTFHICVGKKKSFHISFLTLQTTAVLQEWCVKGPLQKILIFFFIEFLIMAALGNYCFWLDNFKNKFPSETTL